jgi:hypothetical protein
MWVHQIRKLLFLTIYDIDVHQRVVLFQKWLCFNNILSLSMKWKANSTLSEQLKNLIEKYIEQTGKINTHIHDIHFPG